MTEPQYEMQDVRSKAPIGQPMSVISTLDTLRYQSRNRRYSGLSLYIGCEPRFWLDMQRILHLGWAGRLLHAMQCVIQRRHVEVFRYVAGCIVYVWMLPDLVYGVCTTCSWANQSTSDVSGGEFRPRTRYRVRRRLGGGVWMKTFQMGSTRWIGLRLTWQGCCGR